MSAKTRKLICRITGKTLFASKDYYAKKVEKAGSEEYLHNTYICREAKSLLKRGYSIGDTQASLGVADYKCTLGERDIKDIVGDKSSFRLNISEESTAIGVLKTDPDVQEYIKNITSE